MDFKFRTTVLLYLYFFFVTVSLDERIPYQVIDGDPCETCKCEEKNEHFHSAKIPKKHFVFDCSSKHFTHLLPNWPKKFDDIHKDNELHVKYSANNLRILQQLPSTNLTISFSCRHCLISEFYNSVFIDVPHIQSVDLSWNEINGDALTAETFRGPNHLNYSVLLDVERIDLSYNKISYLNDRIFDHCTKLTYLNLDHNTFDNLNNSLMAFKKVALLNELHLSHNKLKTFPRSVFDSLKTLRKLYLQGNFLTTIPSGNDRTLQTLNIANNSLTELDESDFLGMKDLKVLNVSHNKHLRMIKKEAFLNLENLEEIYLGHNIKINVLDIGVLANLKKLTVIDLSHCSLNTLIINNLTSNSWPKLRKVNIQRNPWICNCDLLSVLDLFDQNGTNLIKSFEDHEHKNFARCDSPHSVAGTRLANLSRSYICNELTRESIMSVVDIQNEVDPPKFLRPRNIALTIIAIATVITLGVVIGFTIVIIKRKLKREDFGVSPIRYSTVRNSTMPT